VPVIEGYWHPTRDDTQTLPKAESPPTYAPGELLGCVSGELGLRKFLEERGHTLVVTSDKDGESSEFEKHLADADIVISQPFWPAYITPERFAKAPNLKLCMTAGIGSDHVDLGAAAERGATVTEVGRRGEACCSRPHSLLLLPLLLLLYLLFPHSLARSLAPLPTR
jgi:formate dehydrogenase